jgi:hypothetical protein
MPGAFIIRPLPSVNFTELCAVSSICEQICESVKYPKRQMRDCKYKIKTFFI